jgi:hypothetical protein
MRMGFGYGIGVGLRQPLQYKLDFSQPHNTGYYSIFF